jgi:hypothetical protein
MTFHCLFWTVRILCCDDTTTRALFVFLPLLEDSILVSNLLFTSFISLSVVWERRMEGLKASNMGSLAGGKSVHEIEHRLGWEGRTRVMATKG